jgi:hypothetical protein
MKDFLVVCLDPEIRHIESNRIAFTSGKVAGTYIIILKVLPLIFTLTSIVYVL